jgi:hypothetical protein
MSVNPPSQDPNQQYQTILKGLEKGQRLAFKEGHGFATFRSTERDKKQGEGYTTELKTLKEKIEGFVRQNQNKLTRGQITQLAKAFKKRATLLENRGKSLLVRIFATAKEKSIISQRVSELTGIETELTTIQQSASAKKMGARESVNRLTTLEEAHRTMYLKVTEELQHNEELKDLLKDEGKASDQLLEALESKKMLIVQLYFGKEYNKEIEDIDLPDDPNENAIPLFERRIITNENMFEGYLGRIKKEILIIDSIISALENAQKKGKNTSKYIESFSKYVRQLHNLPDAYETFSGNISGEAQKHIQEARRRQEI